MKYLTLSLFFNVFLCLDAQVKIYDGKLEAKHDVSSTSSSVLKFKTDIYEAALSGTAMFYVEKNLNDIFGLEVGAGITYYSLWNYILMSTKSSGSQNAFYGSGKPSGTTPSNISSYYLPDIEDYKIKIGFAASLFPKIYLEEDPTEGFFIGPQIVFKQFNYETPNASQTGFIPQSLTKLNLTANLGYTMDLSDNIHFEYISGIGASFVTDNRNMTYSSLNTSGLADGKVDYSGTRFHIVSGVRFTYMLY